MSHHSPRVLVVTGTLPGGNGVGEIVLQDLMASTPDVELAFFGVIPRNTNVESNRKCGANIVGTAFKRFETAYRPIRGVIGELISTVALRTLFRHHLDCIIAAAVETGSGIQPDFVWAILDCPTTICVATAIAKRLRVPLRVLVWDDPELLCTQSNYDRFSRSALLTQFRTVIRAAERVAVVGETMQQAYRNRYGCEAVILRHGLPPNAWVTKKSNEMPGKNLTIGFAGSMTAPDAFEAFVASLDKCGWRIADRNVILRIMGARLMLNPKCPQHIEYFGRAPSVERTIELLSQCDLLYLPQPFSPNLRPLAELSFPTKLSTYIAAGRPILLHAPSYASIVPFYQRFPFGVLCPSTNDQAIESSVLKLATDHSVQLLAEEAINATRVQELNQARFIESFREFLASTDEDNSSFSRSVPGQHLHVCRVTQ